MRILAALVSSCLVVLRPVEVAAAPDDATPLRVDADRDAPSYVVSVRADGLAALIGRPRLFLDGMPLARWWSVGFDVAYAKGADVGATVRLWPAANGVEGLAFGVGTRVSVSETHGGVETVALVIDAVHQWRFEAWTLGVEVRAIASDVASQPRWRPELGLAIGYAFLSD